MQVGVIRRDVPPPHLVIMLEFLLSFTKKDFFSFVGKSNFVCVLNLDALDGSLAGCNNEYLTVS